MYNARSLRHNIHVINAAGSLYSLNRVQFLRACNLGDVATVKTLLAKHKEEIDLAKCILNGNPVLYAMIVHERRSIELVKELLMAGANPNCLILVNATTRTIFQHLVNNPGLDKLKFVNLFLCHDVSVLAKDSDGYTALGIAVEQEEPEIVKAILNYAVGKESNQNHRQFYQLCNFMIDDNLKDAKELLDQIDDIDFSDMEEIKPMRFAIKFGKHNFMKMFIDFKNKKK